MAAVQTTETERMAPRTRALRRIGRSRPGLRLIPGSAALLNPKAADALILASRPLYPTF